MPIWLAAFLVLASAALAMRFLAIYRKSKGALYLALLALAVVFCLAFLAYLSLAFVFLGGVYD